ncbi:ribosome recycling factor [Dehalococcoidia bacterium]|nr:ribosome recycling factor [Dehalococcoidia bacterium]MCL0037263.1 ribosome recycling factor [Dehalococcoidia bacterium]MCL0048186.1 ribosome recycling factor [Dehalococcoidia bacterium]MCL0050670.1 ribosome recycling factor [Dehalococcoidia bacterium]MCL0064651.1 ribosome recycling factor [Dehalococcoidia bacterium]
MISDVLVTTEAKMTKAVEVLGRELAVLRTGRASPSLLEHIRVDYYGTPTPLNQLAGISAPEARMLIIQPWDRAIVPAIEKAIVKSDLGLNPSSDGNAIRLVIPQLTEERRKELVRVVRKKVEERRIAVRNIRREALEKLRAMEREKEISQDEEKRALNQLQALTDRFIEKVDRIGKDKETEVLET